VLQFRVRISYPKRYVETKDEIPAVIKSSETHAFVVTQRLRDFSAVILNIVFEVKKVCPTDYPSVVILNLLNYLFLILPQINNIFQRKHLNTMREQQM
jgi:hypothetical protein